MPAAVADYLIELLVDGKPADIVLVAASESDAVRQVQMDRGRGEMIAYRTPSGQPFRIVWKNVATLEFGDVEMVRDYRPQ